jgi:SAM-dependent methyltransferase
MQATNNQRISSDQVFYDQEPIASASDHEVWMREIKFYFSLYADDINNRLAGTNGKIAELGAGSCGLSVCLSGLSNVKHIVAVDISMARMQKMIGMSVNILGGDISKIEPMALDFNNVLPFEDASLDAILFDAALHHSRAIWHLLSECRRVLKKGGLLIAQRESYLSPFRAKKQLGDLLKTPEVAANVSENMYLLAQYDYYLRVNGFEVCFKPWSSIRLKRILRVFNGSLFCDGVLWCEVQK